MSYVAELGKHEHISDHEQPEVTMVVLPSVVQKLNNHPYRYPNDPLLFDRQGGAIIGETSSTTLPDRTLGSMLLRECVRYARLALSYEGIRITDEKNLVIGTVIPENLDNTFLDTYFQRTVVEHQGTRKLSLLRITASRGDANALQAIASQHDTLLGDVFTYGYEFRTQLRAALEPGTDMTLVSKNGDEKRLLIL